MRTLNSILAFVLLFPWLAGCGPKPMPARERYVSAINARLAGDSRAYHDELIALAHEEPETRAGRRARAALSSGGAVTGLAVTGVVAAIAIPNFIKFQARAKQAEAKDNLRGLALFEDSTRVERQRYTTKLPERVVQGFAPRNYYYFIDAERPFAGPDNDLTGPGAEEARLALAALDLHPAVSPDSYLAVALGNLDEDPDYDVWTIDESGTLVHFLDDL